MLLKPAFIAILVAYVIGSLPWAVWVGYAFSGKDIRNGGSGNAGATNTYRMIGIGPGIIVFLLDAGKGALVAWLCWTWNLSAPWMIVAGFFVMVGHIYPVLGGFSGGKGISTAAGVLSLVDPLAFFVALVLFVFILWRFRVASAASITAGGVAFLTAMAQMIFLGDPWMPVAVTGLFLVMILITHRDNIRRLKSGTESRLSKREG
jgi:acyl phosphate:glycerol-3-phosphate acyltransferase